MPNPNFTDLFLVYNHKVLIDPRTEKNLISAQMTYNIPPIAYPKLKIEESALESQIVMMDYSDLRKYGYVIISKRVRGNQRWFKQQRVRYKLELKSMAGIRGVCPEIPPNTKIQLDKIKRRIRLAGKNVSETGVSKWIELK